MTEKIDLKNRFQKTGPVFLTLGFAIGIFFMFNQKEVETALSIEDNAQEPTMKTTPLEIGNSRVQVEIADSRQERIKGLSGRSDLEVGQGLYFIFERTADHGIWMKDMNFPIDIIWIFDQKVVGIEKEVPNPPSGVPDYDLEVYRPPKPVNAVLEVPAGWSDKEGIKVGDEVSWVE